MPKPQGSEPCQSIGSPSIAQVINFLILVWLLKRFLYKPILHAIDEREKGIATQLAEAEAKKADAQKERDDFQHKNEAFDQERAALLKKATDEAQAERQRLLDEARKDADVVARQTPGGVAKRTTEPEPRHHPLDPEGSLCHRAKDAGGPRRHEPRGTHGRGVRSALRALTGAAKEQLAAALKTSTQPARVRSAFDLPPEQHAAIQKAVNETFSADIHIQFETVPELVSGIELSANGQKVAWSIADYLATLEKSAGELLHEDAKPESRPEAKSKPEAEAVAKPSRSANLNTGLNRWPRPQRRTIE